MVKKKAMNQNIHVVRTLIIDTWRKRKCPISINISALIVSIPCNYGNIKSNKSTRRKNKFQIYNGDIKKKSHGGNDLLHFTNCKIF